MEERLFIYPSNAFVWSRIWQFSSDIGHPSWLTWLANFYSWLQSVSLTDRRRTRRHLWIPSCAFVCMVRKITFFFRYRAPTERHLPWHPQKAKQDDNTLFILITVGVGMDWWIQTMVSLPEKKVWQKAHLRIGPTHQQIFSPSTCSCWSFFLPRVFAPSLPLTNHWFPGNSHIFSPPAPTFKVLLSFQGSSHLCLPVLFSPFCRVIFEEERCTDIDDDCRFFFFAKTTLDDVDLKEVLCNGAIGSL